CAAMSQECCLAQLIAELDKSSMIRDSERHFVIVVANASTLANGTNSPVLLSRIASRTPDTSHPIAGVPHEFASIMTIPYPSLTDGTRSRCDLDNRVLFSSFQVFGVRLIISIDFP